MLMLRRSLATLVFLAVASTAAGQSLFVPTGERGAEGSVSWSVGPSSNGVELHGAASLDGRWDVGFGVNRYTLNFDDGSDSSWTEWTPFVRYFVFKEDDDAVPVSFAVHAQYFQDNFEGDDTGWYVLTGANIYKKLALTDTFALYPYVGFSLAGESYTFGGETDRAIYVTRLFGVHGLVTLADGTWLRISVEDHSFRRETYRALRAALVRRF